MKKITSHPILEIPASTQVTFYYNNKPVTGEKGFTIAAALHQAGYPVHSHSLRNRNRSLECGIGKCGACEMLVDGKIKRICITKVDGVKHVSEVPKDYTPDIEYPDENEPVKVYVTRVAIVGAGPAGLACRENLIKHGVSCIVVDNNSKIGGQFIMQTHQFFFFEKKRTFGGLRGFQIAEKLAGEDHTGIFLNCTVWDILEGQRLAVKNLLSGEIFYVLCDYLVVATGAVPFLPPFENDDLPGVYTAAVIQKMMNNEFTLLGKNILTVGAGNIGYLTSYQLMQAGARVKAIIEAQPFEGGFPVQANRIRRLGIPILTSKILVKAIPNADLTGITGAVIADCKHFNPVKGTEEILDGIDAINICTGLVPDDQLLIKGKEVFGRKVFAAGDAMRIGEGTSAVLRGKQVAYEILEDMGVSFNYDDYLLISKEYIDSQQHPVRVIESPFYPSPERMSEKPFVLIDCLYGFACNPCEFACPHDAIRKTSTSTVPYINFSKCTGCLQCIHQCPGLAIFGFDLNHNRVFLPTEFETPENIEVFLVDNHGKILDEGFIEKILKKTNKTHVARVKVKSLEGKNLLHIRGFIQKELYPSPLTLKPYQNEILSEQYLCHCDDVRLKEILDFIGNRKFISVDEVKHATRLGMGACRGKRCIRRLKISLREKNISLVGEPTPRGPLSNQISLSEVFPRSVPEQIIPFVNSSKIKTIKVDSLVAGGGIGGSALFRYLAQAGLKPLLINYGRGASWRNIAGGRPTFSIPELSDIAYQNLQIFKELQKTSNIDFQLTQYVTFAHDEHILKTLEASMAWSDAEIIEPRDFSRKISPFINPQLKTYLAALITRNCWQASPGKVVDLIRQIGLRHGGSILEDCELIDVHKNGTDYVLLVRTHEQEFVEYHTSCFINAMGPQGDKFAKKLGIETGLYPVKHQAFITRRLPFMGVDGKPLPMLIDRRQYKGFTAVYGQQLAETGQIIGCASPQTEPYETDKNLKINSKDFLEIISEMFINWIPRLSSVGFQAVWAGYYVEPRMILDPDAGLFIGLRGQGFMLGQYLAKIYVDKITGNPVPPYFDRLTLKGDGLLEKAFK